MDEDRELNEEQQQELDDIFAEDEEEGQDAKSTEESSEDESSYEDSEDEQVQEESEPEPEPEPEPQPVQTVQPTQSRQETNTSVAIAEELQDEYAELEHMNPQAAKLALEDSFDGQMIRDRLEKYGADNALDRAELIISRRIRQYDAARQQEALQQQAHNAFMGRLRADHPDIYDNPKRTAQENSRLLSDMKSWIEGKPYKEAEGMMNTFLRGTDAAQVSALITRWKNERGSNAKSYRKPDPKAAMMVRRSGTPSTPQVIDNDDFESGWNAPDRDEPSWTKYVRSHR